MEHVWLYKLKGWSSYPFEDNSKIAISVTLTNDNLCFPDVSLQNHKDDLKLMAPICC